MIPILIEVLRTNHWCDYNVGYTRDTPLFGNSGHDTGDNTRKIGIFLVEILTIASSFNRGSPFIRPSCQVLQAYMDYLVIYK